MVRITRDRVLLAGTIAGTLIGATFAFLTFAFLGPQLKWSSITGRKPGDNRGNSAKG